MESRLEQTDLPGLPWFAAPGRLTFNRRRGPGSLARTAEQRFPVSAFAGLTRFELVRRFRRQTGLTPHAFQTNVRIARARTMLSAGEPIARVAASCGFADQPHLTRVFRRAVGVTPGRFAAT